jgi:hypothetical protein
MNMGVTPWFVQPWSPYLKATHRTTNGKTVGDTGRYKVGAEVIVAHTGRVTAKVLPGHRSLHRLIPAL